MLEENCQDIASTPAPSSVTLRKPGEYKFADLPLSQEVQESVQIAGYDEPTPIQAKIIPHMLKGRDVLAQSQTGTGKTAAFALPILSRLKPRSRKPQVLVLTPTRELAIQVAKSFATYGSRVEDFEVATIYGGQSYEFQFRQLKRGVQVVVGTPGRIIDHIKQGKLDLSEIECLVLDEADEMLNMGFLQDVEFVLEKTPKKRQIALFSATLPTPIRNIADKYLNEPANIKIQNKTMTADLIRQRALFVSPRDKVEMLSRILESEETDGVIVFTKTREATVNVADKLKRKGFSAVALNGDMPQNVRERTIEQLKAGHLDILVATDVAARGLDVTRVSHVFNFDLPHDSESYVHRVGRTGRAGRKGEAIIFLTNSQRGKLRTIERATKQKIEIINPPSVDNINNQRVEKFKKEISDVIAGQDLSFFNKLIKKFADESSLPMESIAAALAHIGQKGQSFFMEENRGKRNREDGRSDFGNRERGQGSRQSGGRDGRGGRQIGPPNSGMKRFRISVGHRDSVRPGNIVGAVANEGGLDSKFIGPIKIYDSYSTVDLPADLQQSTIEVLKKTWVTGRQLRLCPEGEKPEGSDNHERRKKSKFANGENRNVEREPKKFVPKYGKSKKSGKAKPGKAKPSTAKREKVASVKIEGKASKSKNKKRKANIR